MYGSRNPTERIYSKEAGETGTTKWRRRGGSIVGKMVSGGMISKTRDINMMEAYQSCISADSADTAFRLSISTPRIK